MPSNYGFETEGERQARLAAEKQKVADELAAREAIRDASLVAGRKAGPIIRDILRDYASAQGLSDREPKFSERPPGWAVPFEWHVYGESPVDVQLLAGTVDRPRNPPQLMVSCSVLNTDHDMLTLGRLLYDRTKLPVRVVRERGGVSGGGEPTMQHEALVFRHA